MALGTDCRGSRTMRRLAAATAVALLFCACAAVDLAEPSPAVKELLRRNYSETSDGPRSCATEGFHFTNTQAAFQFDSPGLDLIHCVAAEQAEHEFSDGDVYFVMLSASADSPARYKCKMCDGTWYPVDRNPMLQRRMPECGVPEILELDLAKHPAGVGRRLDGVRCHGAYIKGCEDAYSWCHGRCCRTEALFYYPQLQKPIGAGRLLTARSAGPRETPLLRLLTPATKSATKTAGRPARRRRLLNHRVQRHRPLTDRGADC